MNRWGEGSRRGGSKAPKNDPFRFEGEGLSFRAKLIGSDDVECARGDRMCQEVMQRLKNRVKLSGEHKQRILVGVSLQGIKIRDDKTGELVFHHPVHKISFISQDSSDTRAFGYVCGCPQGGHTLIAIKTEKAASLLVVALRDLFQVVLEMKQHEMLRAKQSQEKRRREEGGLTNGANFSQRGEVQEILRDQDPQESRPAVVDDLLDLQFELDSLQLGIEQMESLATGDPFDTSFVPDSRSRPSRVFFSEPPTPMSPVPPLLPPPRVLPSFIPLTPGEPIVPPRPPQSLPLRLTNPFATVSLPATPAVPQGPALPPKKPPSKDLFAELDPLSRDRPYRDRTEFFQELKKPAKKALRELGEEESVPSCRPVPSWETFEDSSQEKLPPPSFPPPPPPKSSPPIPIPALTENGVQAVRPLSMDEGFCSGASSVSPSLPREAPIFGRKNDPFADDFFSRASTK